MNIESGKHYLSENGTKCTAQADESGRFICSGYEGPGSGGTWDVDAEGKHSTTPAYSLTQKLPDLPSDQWMQQQKELGKL